MYFHKLPLKTSMVIVNISFHKRVILVVTLILCLTEYFLGETTRLSGEGWTVGKFAQ